NLKQLGLAAHNYESSNNTLPPGAGPLPNQATGGTSNQRPSVQVMILPYVEQANKYNQFNLTEDVYFRAWFKIGHFWVTPRTICDLARTASSACPDRGARRRDSGSVG